MLKISDVDYDLTAFGVLSLYHNILLFFLLPIHIHGVKKKCSLNGLLLRHFEVWIIISNYMLKIVYHTMIL